MGHIDSSGGVLSRVRGLKLDLWLLSGQTTILLLLLSIHEVGGLLKNNLEPYCTL